MNLVGRLGEDRMKSAALTFLVGAACLGLAGCGDRTDEAAAANNMSAAAAAPPVQAPSGEGNGAGSYWDPLPGGGAANGAQDSGGNASGAARPGPGEIGSIVTENGTHYRVGPGDARVRVDAQGNEIPVDQPDPDVPQ